MPYKDPEKRKQKSAEYYKKWRKANREKDNAYKRDRNKKYRSDNVNWLRDLKKTSKCKNCGENHIACLQFHHKNPLEKERNINQAVVRWSLQRLMKEIEKCEILCANCHFKLHWKE